MKSLAYRISLSAGLLVLLALAGALPEDRRKRARDLLAAVGAERLQRLLDLQNRIQAELNLDLLGRELETLVTGPGKSAGQATGRTSCNRIVHFETGRDATAPPRPGTLERIRITRALPHSLIGERILAPASEAVPPPATRRPGAAGNASLPVLG